ncbi:hypothetical protein KKH19_00920 [Patescibacteria group bacterium]|nr:hypothetical protein [Patescibacteria group bacterium]
MRLRRKSAGLKNLLCVPPSAEWKKLEINFVYCVLRTPNRRLLSRKTEFEFVRPYDLIPKYLPAVAEKAQEGRAFCEARPAPASPCGINSGGASEQQNTSEFSKCLNWSQLLNEARTYFEQNPD